MIHYVYETRNLINNKIYIGVRSSKHYDDGYFGSGKLLKRAVKKYGYQNFVKTILWVYGTSKDAYNKEAEIVNEQFVKRKDTYNVATGGRGGYLGEDVNEKRSQSLKGHYVSEQTREKISKANAGRKYPNRAKWSAESRSKLSNLTKGRIPHNKGVPHSEQSKAKMRKPHRSTGPKIRLSCLGCCGETTVNALWRHKDC